MKKIFSIITVLSMFFTMPFTVFAAETDELNSIPEDKVLILPYCETNERIKIPVGDAEYIDDGNGNLAKISDLMSFDTQEEADTYINEMLTELETPIQNAPILPIATNSKSTYRTKATYGDTIVAKHHINLNSYIKLGVIYTTSGNAHTGTITSHKAYTTFTGFSLGFSWNEELCHSEVTSSGKDIYAIAKGTLAYSLLVDGFIELGREGISLKGYCAAVR